MFVPKGNIADDASGDVRARALAWRAWARQELLVLEPVVAAEQCHVVGPSDLTEG